MIGVLITLYTGPSRMDECKSSVPVPRRSTTRSGETSCSRRPMAIQYMHSYLTRFTCSKKVTILLYVYVFCVRSVRTMAMLRELPLTTEWISMMADERVNICG